MNKEEQKLVGYIIYNIWSYRTKGPRDADWKHQVASPEVEWKKKIYLTEASAKEAAKQIEENSHDLSFQRPVIIPIYANRSDFDAVRERWNEAKEEADRLNRESKESGGLEWSASL
jgi:hypothetical protein